MVILQSSNCKTLKEKKKTRKKIVKFVKFRIVIVPLAQIIKFK